MLEVLKQAYQLLLTEPHAPTVCNQLEVILRQAIAELESQEPDYKEALRVLSLALEEAPQNLTPKQRSVWRQSRDVLLSGGGLA
jgi:hypothetical protein